MTRPSAIGIPVAGDLDAADGSSGVASTVAPSIMSAVTESGSMPVTARLASSRYSAPADAGREREEQADAGGGAGGAGEDDDARAGQHDPQPVELAPRAQDGHAEGPDELDGHDDADRACG